VDLRTNTESILAQMAAFFGFRPDRQRIQQAVLNNFVQQMRAKENRAKKQPTSAEVN
jgi:hypothetical protein